MHLLIIDQLGTYSACRDKEPGFIYLASTYFMLLLKIILIVFLCPPINNILETLWRQRASALFFLTTSLRVLCLRDYWVNYLLPCSTHKITPKSALCIFFEKFNHYETLFFKPHHSFFNYFFSSWKYQSFHIFPLGWVILLAKMSL